MNDIPQVKTEAEARAVCDLFGLKIGECKMHYDTETSLALYYKHDELVWVGAKWYVDRYKITHVVSSFLEYWWRYLAPNIQARILEICKEVEDE